ncbi:hypothetical protein AB1K40_09750 [Vibrio cholerae]|uniref:hypothetical protein n=2 Tax=Vibrio cholerae TaxID=666 RepID=UPI003453A873
MELIFVLLFIALFCFYMVSKASKKKDNSLTPKAKNAKPTGNVALSVSITTSDSYADEKEYEEVSPIPFDERKIMLIDGQRYYVAWVGTSPEATFSVNRKEKVTMSPNHILIRNDAIHVAEINGDDIKVIPTLEISSQIQVKGHNRRSFWEWMRIINPNFSWNFHRAYPEYETSNRDYSLIWEGELAPTTFTRYVHHGYDRTRKRETVTPIALYKGKLTGETKLKIIDSEQKEITFCTGDIDTMLATEGYKKMHFNDWVSNVLSVQG